MTDNINPYSPPHSEVLPQSWWAQLKSILFSAKARRADFPKGEAIVCGGIAFFIDPYESKTLYAGSPSSDHSDDRFALVAREAVRHLPDFLAMNRHSKLQLNDRRLVVRIVNDYSGIFSDYVRAAEVLPAPLTNGLDVAQRHDDA